MFLFPRKLQECRLVHLQPIFRRLGQKPRACVMISQPIEHPSIACCGCEQCLRLVHLDVSHPANIAGLDQSLIKQCQNCATLM